MIHSKSKTSGETNMLYSENMKKRNMTVEKNIMEFKRIFWILCCMIAGACAIYFTRNLYYNCDKNAIIVSINTLPTPVEEIPFPAVTICNANSVKKSEAEDVLKRGTIAEKRMLEEICYKNSSSNLQNNDDDSWNDRYNFMLRVHHPCEDMLKVCKWRLNNIDCSRLFTTTLTDEGFCCTFNQLPMNYILRHPMEMQKGANWGKLLRDSYQIEDWNPERGYLPSAPTNVFPFRSPGPGKSLGLTVTLDVDAANYYCSTSSSIGFKVLLHNPAEIQRVVEDAFLLPSGVEADVLFTPQIKDASTELKAIPVDKRRCYFIDERNLVHYRTYTSANCKMECLAHSMLEMCGCVFDFLPRNESTPVCRQRQGKCNSNLEDEITFLKLSTNSKNTCSCYSGCFTLGFEKRMSYGEVTGGFRLKDFYYNLTKEYIQGNIAILHVYFSDSQFTTFTTSVLCNFTNLVSSTGGLLALFLGFSVLSVAQIFYYLTLNILCKVLQIKFNLDVK